MKLSFSVIAGIAFSCVLLAASLAIRHDRRSRASPAAKPLSTAAVSAPKARITVPKRALGVVAKGDVMTGFVIVANVGTEPLRLRAEGGGCRSPQFREYRKVIPPGSTEELAIEICVSQPGKHAARAEVLTDDPDNAIADISYTYTVEGDAG